MFDASGALNRQKLGSLVFSAPQELQRLNGIIYSHLGAEIDARLARQRGARCAAVDGINMLQARAAGAFQCDCMVGVIAPDALRLRRIMARDHISEEYAKKRIDAQPGSDFYREHCDAVLENVYDSTTVFEQAVKVFFEDLLSLYESKKEKEDHV